MAFTSCFVSDWLALIIPLFAFVINLVLHLFTFYSFLAFSVRWKKSPYRIGRGSSPRNRTGCDIFSFWQSRILRLAANRAHKF
jgi:hypothetical protein